MAIRYFPAVIERGNEGFGVFFPDFPGCITGGDNLEEAARNAEGVLALHVRSMIEDSDPIPEPTPLDQVERDPEVDEVARILVRAELPGKSVRLSITMEEGLLASVDAAAKRVNTNRSAFLAAGARELLRQQREA